MSSEDLFADSLPSNLSPGSLGSTPIDASGVVGSDLDDSISLPSDFELSDCFMLSDDEVVPSSDEDAEDADSEMDVADLGGVDVKKDLVSPRRSSTRRKRGAFKKGFLKQRRRSRSSSRGSSSSRDPSLGSYSDAVSEFLNAELTDGDEGSHHGDSCYSTMPSEGEMTVGVDDDDDDREQEIEQTEGKLKPSPTVQRRRKSKMIGRKKKYFWKDPPENATETEPSEKVTHTEKSVKDFGTSTEVKDLKMSLEYASSSLSGDQILSTVADYLKLTIDNWVVSLSDGTLMLCKIINPLNPYVERAITWDGKKVNFLVHNTPLPSRNVCWSIKRPDPGNIGSVADYLTTVANRVDYFEVCSGIQTHQHIWSKFSNGTCTENHSGSPVMRSSKCCYLRVYAGRCSNCHGILTKMLDHERKLSKKSEDRDESKTNYRYLSKEDLEKKCRRIQQEKKLSKQAVRRLRKRIDILLKKIPK
ncbi:hypothetical protein ONE63_011145 [Megalurothrips usitatus]|uniref:Uncharacterized protein n=1 Tax=Megalurothrips usitatus TaxID=439358 RepID=A0AAV7XJ83_9NEOP|nr:hypothetical protein ONE63_011145 [Megalurothrips usitatus]